MPFLGRTEFGGPFDAYYEALQNLGAEYVRFAPWFPNPRVSCTPINGTSLCTMLSSVAKNCMGGLFQACCFYRRPFSSLFACFPRNATPLRIKSEFSCRF